MRLPILLFTKKSQPLRVASSHEPPFLVPPLRCHRLQVWHLRTTCLWKPTLTPS
jgi:hypothetical protein